MGSYLTLQTSLSVLLNKGQGLDGRPLLWLIYISDVEVKGCTITKYADNCTVHGSAKEQLPANSLQPLVDEVSSWCMANDMLLNATELITMNIDPTQIPLNSVFQINNTILANTSH